MDSELRQRMLTYYNERALEYEEAYTLGTGTASLLDPDIFKAEASRMAGIVGTVVRGRVMDLACGTAYWLPHYASNASHVTLLDQSGNMLAEARVKATRLGIIDRCDFVQADFFGHEFRRHRCDTVLVGFLMSHLTDDEERPLFHALREMLGSSGRFLILDSAWSPERARVNTKTGRQMRRLNDGTTFEIYKRYCDRDDISRWQPEHDVELHVEHFGRAFLAVSGRFRSVSNH